MFYSAYLCLCIRLTGSRTVPVICWGEIILVYWPLFSWFMMIFQAVMLHTNQAVSHPYKIGTMKTDLWLNHRPKLWYPRCDSLLAHRFTVFIQFPGQQPSGGAIVIQIFIWFPWKTRFIITMITRKPWKPDCDFKNHSVTLTALCYFDTATFKTVCYNGCLDPSVPVHYPSYIHF